ncbi:MAG: hypothetical protein OXC09_00315 [Truepera sp.]|nr:hypothetical protein [Truepera sp.]
MAYIYGLVKFFDNPKYADAFSNGQLHAERLRYFKNLEDESAGRGDKYEGVAANLQLHKGRLIIGEHRFTSGSASIQMNWLDYLNVFCMHAIHGGDFELTSENLGDFRKCLEIPEEGLRKFGKYGVAITDVPQFIDRVKTKARLQGYQVWNKLVKYYDPETSHEFFGKGLNSPEAEFNKHNKYRWQREFRFVIHTGVAGTKAIDLDIGDISDISFPIDIADINKGIKIQASRSSS